MKKILIFLSAFVLSMNIYGAVQFTWTSGVNFFQEDVSANRASLGWFTLVSPFNGNVNTIKVNLSTVSGGGINRTDAYMAISADLKTTTTNFSESDFVGISTNTCGTTDLVVTMQFDNTELVGGATYYCYFVTKNGDVYTTINNRFYVVTGQPDGKMLIGNAGQTNAAFTTWVVPFEGTMTLKESAQYRIKGYWGNDAIECWIYSRETEENKLCKIKTTDATSTLANNRYIWNVTSDEGLKLQNVGNSHYIPNFTAATSNGSNVNYLSATDINDAVALTPTDRVDAGKIGYVKLGTTFNNAPSWIDTYTNQNNYVGCHNAEHGGNRLFFMQVKKVTFTEAVAVNGEDEVTEIYLAADGSEEITLPSEYLYSINGGDDLNAAEAASAIAAYGTSELTVTTKENPVTDVTYKLVWGESGAEIMTSSASVKAGENASEFLPAAMANDFVTFSYSPEVIPVAASEVIVTATWNGPFQLSNANAPKYYTVGIHSAHKQDNHIWNNEDNMLATQSVQTNAYADLTDANLFYFSGNPYDGITITSKNGGSVNKVDDNGTQATISDEGSIFIPVASTESGRTIANGYACFKLKDGTRFLNCYDSDGYKVKGWTDAGNGSTCWFIPAGEYYKNNIDALALAAPLGAVGTSEYFTATNKAELTAKRAEIEANPYGDIDSYAEAKSLLDAIKEANIIALEDGYYRVVSAVPGFNNTAAWYYNPATDDSHIRWAKEATTAAQQINSLFKFTANGDGWDIYSPNSQRFITTGNGVFQSQNAELGDAAAVTVNSIGAAQHTLMQSENYQTLHAESHGGGGGTTGKLITYNANGVGEASAWYIVKVEEVSVNLNEIGDSYYATLYAPFAYTVEGATAYTLQLNEGKSALNMKAVEGVVPAGTPVVLVGDAASATLTLAPANDANAAIATALTGVYTAQSIAAGADATNYFLGRKDNTPGFYKYSGATLNLDANRAYLALGTEENRANGFSLNLSDDDITAIVEAIASAADAKTYYDLQGRRVAAPQKGQIYIVNGKKVVF